MPRSASKCGEVQPECTGKVQSAGRAGLYRVRTAHSDRTQQWFDGIDTPESRRDREFWDTQLAIQRAYWDLLAEKEND